MVANDSPHIVINEVMYNPEQNNNYNEWIELYNPTNNSINVSGWSIIDNYAEDFLEGDQHHGNGTTIIPPYSYAIIADHGTKIYENFSISASAIRLYIDDSSIGNGLGNGKDKLILKNRAGNFTDAVEWGYDYLDVPGTPTDLVGEGHSLARHNGLNPNNSSIDFYDGIIPTPGSENKFVNGESLDIEVYPSYIPKIQNNSEYSIPFAIKLNMSNYASNERYQLKAYIAGKLSSTSAATQIWNGTVWKWSYYYVFNITTDKHGNWTDWLYLRFKKDYNEYQRNIENNNTAYLNAKIKKDNVLCEVSREIYLLDMDYSTSNGTQGGCIIGIAKDNNSCLQNKTIIVENITGIVTGIYVTEDNEIDDGLISSPGYYKVAAPVGSGYIVKFLDKNNSMQSIISNIIVKQGEYGIDIHSLDTSYLVRRNETLDIPLTIKNTGDFHDVINISIEYVTDGWYVTLEQEKISLNPKEERDVRLYVISRQQNGSGNATVCITSEGDIGKSNEITFQFDVLAPDLTIATIKNYNEGGEQINIFGEGEIVKIKAFLKNIGNENATNVNVTFYCDYKESERCIGSKHYDFVGKYQKYPIVMWDTTNIMPGTHTIFVVVDKVDQIDELDEFNNELSVEIDIYDTSPSKISKEVLITEIYYHAHTKVNNEFIVVYNPTDYSIDVSGWYITNQPLKTRTKQTKIVFPDDTIMPPESCLYITQNASAYMWETGKKADFEYNVNSDDNVSQMLATKQFILSNNGGAIALKNWYNHTIDIIVYGESDYNASGWKGLSIPDSGAGVILKRNFNKNGLSVDTNASDDWTHARRYGIGQSNFALTSIVFKGNITAFVSPDSAFETIVDEIRNAKETIYFNIYEFTNPFLCDELVAALKRNVSVKLFLEGSPIGGIDDREKFILNEISSHGGEIRLIINDKTNGVFSRYDFDHAKYLIIDNRTTIIESANWGKTGVPKNTTFGNREWGIVIGNKAVATYFAKVFLTDRDPMRCDSYSFHDIGRVVPDDFVVDESVPTGFYSPAFQSITLEGNFTVIPVLSPDNSEKAICSFIESANENICIEQLYIYNKWDEQRSPFVERLVNKSKSGVKIKVILNYNSDYESSNEKNNETKQYLEENGIDVKFIRTDWSYFANIHNKGMIVDNKSVLISSINWNENSVRRNREAGIIIENENVAEYYAEVFFYDWNLETPASVVQEKENVTLHDTSTSSVIEYKNQFCIVGIFAVTIVIIALDWRKREW